MPIGNFASTENTPWATLPLDGGWVQYDNTNVYLPRYRKVGDVIFTTGLPRITAANNTSTLITIATLPEGFRPNQRHSPVMWATNGGRTVILTPDGRFQTAGPLALDFAVWLNYTFSI